MHNNSHDIQVRRTFLRVLRKRRGLSQLELAVRAGLALNTVSLIERSGRMSNRCAALLAKALGVAPTDLKPDFREEP